MVEKTAGMTLEDFMRLYDEEGPFELIDGERIPVSPTMADHGTVAMNLLTALITSGGVPTRGIVRTEQPYVLSYSRKWVKDSRVPDLMFFSQARIESYMAADPKWRSKPYVIVPDLTVEIISPTDHFSDVMKKVKLYLADGVKLIWVIDPQAKIVLVFTKSSTEDRRLTIGDTLDGGELLPEFSIALRDLFA